MKSNVSRKFAASFLDKEYARPQSNKVLHAHPSPKHWRPSEKMGLSRWKHRQEMAHTQQITDNLYLGLPFCIKTEPSHCGFCLFPTQDYEGKSQLSHYLDYLEKEGEIYGDCLKQDKLGSIYVGGGTPNLMRGDEYRRVLDIAERLYGGLPGDIEKTLEGIPQLFSSDKIDAIKSAGFNRVSMGVQQMSDRLIKYSGRKQTRRQVLDAIEEFNNAGLSCNVDLIYGWPEQTVGDMLRDLKDVVDLGVRHITHYQLNIGGLSAFSRKMRPLLPSIEETLEMYRESVRFLSSHGFRQETVYDWERVDPMEGRFDFEDAQKYKYESQVRTLIDVDDQSTQQIQSMVGLGYAAIGWTLNDAAQQGQSWCQMNQRSLPAYRQAIEAKQLPIEREFLYGPDDTKLAYLFHATQELKIDCLAYSKIFQSDLLVDFAGIWEELESRGWIKVSPAAIEFVDVGAFHIPMIQALLSYARVEEIRLERKDAGDQNARRPAHALLA